jgi:hypothetical protein
VTETTVSVWLALQVGEGVLGLGGESKRGNKTLDQQMTEEAIRRNEQMEKKTKGRHGKEDVGT